MHEQEQDELVGLRRALAMAGDISDSTRRRTPDFPSAIVLSRTHQGRPARIAFSRRELVEYVGRRIAASRGPKAAA